MVEIRGIISKTLNRGLSQVNEMFKIPKKHNFKMTFQDNTLIYEKILEIIKKVEPFNTSIIMLAVIIDGEHKGFIIKYDYGMCVYGEDTNIDYIIANKTIKNPKFIYGLNYGDLEYISNIYSTYKECTLQNTVFKEHGSYLIMDNKVATYYENYKSMLTIYSNGDKINIRYNTENRSENTTCEFERKEYTIELPSGIDTYMDFEMFIDIFNNIQTLDMNSGIDTPYFSLLGKGYIDKKPYKYVAGDQNGVTEQGDELDDTTYKFVVTSFSNEDYIDRVVVSVLTKDTVGSFIYNEMDGVFNLVNMSLSTKIDNYILYM